MIHVLKTEEADQAKTNLTNLIEKNHQHLLDILNDEERGNEWKNRFKDFVDFRKIQLEDMPIIAELYSYPNDIFVRNFHNTFDFDKERSGKTIETMIEESKRKNNGLQRFLELFLLLFQKYDRLVVNHLNRIMEDKKEYQC